MATASRGRLLVVEKAPLDDEATPPAELSGRRNYRFWYRGPAEKPRTLATAMPHRDEIEYFRQVEDLARDIYGQLKAMRAEPPGAIARVQPPPLTGRAVVSNGRPTVLLAEVTDDLEFRRLEVQRHLEPQGVLVLPEAAYPLGRTEFEQAIEPDLGRSRLFVQLLGPMPGKRPRDVPEGFSWLQLERARRRGLPVLQWRSPELDPAGVEWPRHRELLELETVQATTLESFKRAIVAALTPRRRVPSNGGMRESAHSSSSIPSSATARSGPRSEPKSATARRGPSRFLKARRQRYARISSRTSSIATQ
jgi:hypothetical protein